MKRTIHRLVVVLDEFFKMANVIKAKSVYARLSSMFCGGTPYLIAVARNCSVVEQRQNSHQRS